MCLFCFVFCTIRFTRCCFALSILFFPFSALLLLFFQLNRHTRPLAAKQCSTAPLQAKQRNGETAVDSGSDSGEPWWLLMLTQWWHVTNQLRIILTLIRPCQSWTSALALLHPHTPCSSCFHIASKTIASAFYFSSEFWVFVPSLVFGNRCTITIHWLLSDCTIIFLSNESWTLTSGFGS